MKVVFAIILTAVSLSVTALATNAAHAGPQPNNFTAADVQR